MRKFLIGTGLCNPDKEPEGFRVDWWFNKNDVGAESIVTLAVGGCDADFFGEVIRIRSNLGHVHDLHAGKDRDYCGWSASIIALAWIAYCDESDFIYCEQDMLAFGDWVSALYDGMGDGGMAFGKLQMMKSAQSLFIVRHSFIPEFTRRYLALANDRTKDWVPENKFHAMHVVDPHNVRMFDFGCDRDRPIPWDDPVFYVQHITLDELEEMKKRGLI